MHSKLTLDNEQGFALLITLFLITVFALLGSAFINVVIDETHIANRYTAKAESFYLAEAALVKGVWYLQKSSEPLAGAETLTGALESGEYEIILTPRAPVGGRQVVEGLAKGKGNGAVTKLRVTWEFVYLPAPGRVNPISWEEED